MMGVDQGVPSAPDDEPAVDGVGERASDHEREREAAPEEGLDRGASMAPGIDATYTPSFRALFAYFAWRHPSGAFQKPEQQAAAQQRWDWQMHLSFLLGLDWRIPRDLHLVRQREAQLVELKKAAKGGALGAVIGTVAELRPQVAVAEDRAAKLGEELSRFQVREGYREMMDRATALKMEMQAFSRRAVPLRETLAHLRDALSRERVPQRDDVSRLYEAVGIELPGVAKRRFDDVERFHRSVVENRRVRLQEEIDEIEGTLRTGEARMVECDRTRGEILRLLEGQGALEDFTVLQRRLAEAEAEAASLRERFKSAEALGSEMTQLSIDRISIQRRLQQDHQSRQERLTEAILLIGEAIEALYEGRKGGFEVEASDKGPEFRISIQGDRGGGISSMEIFCLDHALFSMWSRRGKGPGFLIHDNHLFDGVDARQVSRALGLGAATAQRYGVQYIATMNSDVFDGLELPVGLDRDSIVLPTRLSDTEETGGLFGFWFD
jgi:uncharacterized protein YydD (DUF2326 family)